MLYEQVGGVEEPGMGTIQLCPKIESLNLVDTNQLGWYYIIIEIYPFPYNWQYKIKEMIMQGNNVYLLDVFSSWYDIALSVPMSLLQEAKEHQSPVSLLQNFWVRIETKDCSGLQFSRKIL